MSISEPVDIFAPTPFEPRGATPFEPPQGEPYAVSEWSTEDGPTARRVYFTQERPRPFPRVAAAWEEYLELRRLLELDDGVPGDGLVLEAVRRVLDQVSRPRRPARELAQEAVERFVELAPIGPHTRRGVEELTGYAGHRSVLTTALGHHPRVKRTGKATSAVRWEVVPSSSRRSGVSEKKKKKRRREKEHPALVALEHLRKRRPGRYTAKALESALREAGWDVPGASAPGALVVAEEAAISWFRCVSVRPDSKRAAFVIEPVTAL